MNASDSLIEQSFQVEAARRIVADTLARYGHEPCTRAQAAAHEAGHWIVGDTMGLGPYRFLRVFRNHGLWLGENQAIDRSTAHLFEETERYRKHALQVIAGFLGEMAAGHCYPASSIDERTMFLAMCRSLSTVHGSDARDLCDSAVKVVTAIIDARRADFDRVRHHLERHPRILKGQLERMSKPNPLPWLERWESMAVGKLLEESS